MSDFPQHLRHLEIEAILFLSRRRSKLETPNAVVVSPITAFEIGQPDEVDRAVASLNREALVELTALMWLGRGASGEEASDWLHLLKSAAAQHSGDSFDPEYVSSKLPLDEYIETGLHKLGYVTAITM